MNINWKVLTGAVITTGVVGLAAYSIYLYKKEQKAEEESMSVEEAKELVEAEEEYRANRARLNTEMNEQVEDSRVDITPDTWVPYTGLPSDEVVDALKSRVESVPYNTVKVANDIRNVLARPAAEVEEENRLEDHNQMLEDLKEPEVIQEPILLTDEGEFTLRYDPNSDEALLQYLRMELSDWAPHEETYKTLEALFDLPFQPSVDGDVALLNRLTDYRAHFFGPASRWVTHITYADMILHFARAMNFHTDGGIRVWASNILGCHDISIVSQDLGHIEGMLMIMTDHDYEETDANGLFAISDRSLRQANDIAARNIDGQVTYEIEYNEYLKEIMGGR